MAIRSTKPAHVLKTPAPANKGTLNPSGKPAVQPVNTSSTVPTGGQSTSGTPAQEFGNYARFSDEGAAISQVQSTPTPDLGYDDTPLANADGVPHYIYISEAPLMAVGKRI